jgi:hypothetical protein
MNVHDYLLNVDGFDWHAAARNWTWLLPGGFRVWIVNRFGEAFVSLPDGSIARFSPVDGTFEALATNRDEFIARVDDNDNFNNWFLAPLVDQLVLAGKTLNRDECYNFITLPILGGQFELNNISVLKLSDMYLALGPLHFQLKDVADGTEIQFRIEP